MNKLIIFFFISILFFAGVQKASAVTTVMDVSLKAYFVDEDKPCSAAAKTNINETGEKILKLCVGGQNYQSWGFDFNITCGGVVECIISEAGLDIAPFLTEEIVEKKFGPPGADGNLAAIYFRGGLIDPVSVNRPLNLATIKVNVTSLESGKISFRKKDVFLNDQKSEIANVTETVVNIGADSSPGPNPTSAPPFSGYDSDQIPEGAWVQDADVTFAGKMASRSASFLSFALDRYQWSQLTSTGTNPFTSFWKNILNIVYAFALGLVLISAFVMIWTRGQNITIMRFVPRFILILLLATFSFTLIKFLYEATDIIQGFFLKHKDGFINASDLINMDFGYRDFVGYRLYGPAYDESTFITVLLTKLTALSYYIMAGVLLVRKVILWFFIIISPVFPLLLFYPTIRNTAKIWVGEFFRWLLYAPIFAILLSGLVSFWESYIPLSFEDRSAEEALYPTATNILLGGPGQNVSQGNSINQPETFILYIVSLFMVWVVIILPFILLRVFMDYMQNVSFSENSYMKKVISSNFPYLEKYGVIKGPSVSPPPPVLPISFGIAKKLPFINKLPILGRPTWEEGRRADSPSVIPANAGIQRTWIPGQARNDIGTVGDDKGRGSGAYFGSLAQPLSGFATGSSLINRTRQILQQANIKIPTIRDIARIETSLLSNDTKIQDAKGVFERLEKIANPSLGMNTTEAHQYSSIKDQLVKESSSNNVFAKTVLAAASKAGEIRQTERIIEKIKQIGAPAILSRPTILGVTASPAKQGQPATWEEGLPSIVIPAQAGIQEIRERLIKEGNSNTFASSVLSSVNTISVSRISKEKQITLTNSLVEKLKTEKEKGNILATTILQSIAPSQAGIVQYAPTQGVNVTHPKGGYDLPVVNRVQTVSLDDYEAVKTMWTENYQKMEVSQVIDGIQTRKGWIEADIEKISETIQLLTQADPRREKEGMDMVGEILPFLLIGGFSKTEIIAYLKAKLQAGKAVLDQIGVKEEEEETKVEVQSKTEEEKGKEMTAETVAEDKLKVQS